MEDRGVTRLSLVLCSRDDDWESSPGNRPIDRLRRSLEYALARMGADDEIIVIDWGSMVPLGNTLDDLPDEPAIRFVYVTPERCKAAGSSFNEVAAINYACRLAKGKWAGHIDQDTLVGDRFWAWMNGCGPQPGTIIWSGRRNMVEGQTEPTDADYIDCLDSNPTYWKASTGIMLAERELWHQVRGMDEKLSARNHMHHDLLVRMQKSAKLVSIGGLLQYPCHHLWHPRTGHAARPHNLQPSDEYLASVPEIVNGESWGLADLLK